MSARRNIALVAAMSIATVAIGLRIGAGESVRAAIIMGAPLPHEGGRVAWQLRTQDDDGRSRSAAETSFVLSARARGVTRAMNAATNVDGVAELPLDVPDLAWGDRIELVVRDPRGDSLASGVVTWPKVMPQQAVTTHQLVRPSRSEGTLRMRVAVLGGALAPNQPGRVWVTTSAAGEPPRNVRIDATPDLGIEVDKPFAANHDPSCARAGVIEVIARGHSGGIMLRAKDDLGREGEWYGSLPIAAGAMHVTLPVMAQPGPVHATITSASAQSVAYVEVDDDVGRVDSRIVPLTGEPPSGELTFELRHLGRSFVVVSGGPDGATNIAGATRAIPIWIGDNAPCEAELAESTAQAFPRFVALDGFDAKRVVLAARRKRGRLIALGALVLGSFLETLLLLRAAREGRQAPSPRKGAFDIVLVLMLSLLGFVLLFALVEWTSR